MMCAVLTVLVGLVPHATRAHHAAPCCAVQVAEKLRAAGWLPEVVICSNAKRTRQTLDVLAKVIPELEDADAHFLGSHEKESIK